MADGFVPTGLFPPVIRPELTQQLRFEFDRMADHLETITIEAPSIEYLAPLTRTATGTMGSAARVRTNRANDLADAR